MTRVLAAEATWTGARFERGVRITLGDDGRIAAVGREAVADEVRLDGRALLPGFVNAHSHAFQRGLRGKGEHFPAGAGSFWTWREAMYALVAELDAERMYELVLAAYREMLAAGITTVGEFHYLHHGPPADADAAGEGDFALDDVVLRAAKDAGIRLVLLQAYYAQGGIGKPLSAAQRRFRTASPEVYWRQFDRLAERLDPATQTLGCVVHSVRAATPDELAAVASEARRRGLVLHMHLEEQRLELEDCRAAYGRGPTELALERGAVDERFTSVHATHTSRAAAERLFSAGATVCICPTTEANLGDGIAALHEFDDVAGGAARLALGTDSNARISMLEELRWLEYVQRLARERRGVLRAAESEAGDVAGRLLAIATAGGARALGVAAGILAPGSLADFVSVDLTAPALAGVDVDDLAAALAFGCGDEVLVETHVGGRRVAGGARLENAGAVAR